MRFEPPLRSITEWLHRHERIRNAVSHLRVMVLRTRSVWWLQIESDDQTELLGGSIDGLDPADIPRVVSNLLNDRGRGVEIRIQPEPLPDDHHYVVEWQYLAFDYGTMTWQPVRDRVPDGGV